MTSVNNNLGENTYLLENGVDTATYVGEGNILLNGVTTRTAFCVAIFIDIQIGVTYNTALADIASVNNGMRVGWLLDTVLPTLTSPQQGAGLQMAIWDIVNDNGDGFSAGGVQGATGANATDSVALSYANNYESMSLGKSADAWVYLNYDMTTGAQAQTLMGFVKLTDGGPVAPEPGTFGIVMTGLVVAGIMVRRKTR